MVKKAAQSIPNQLLRRARLERGWTQKVVAERIGAPNDMMVARWETGKAFPSAYYIERLCQLFERKASDLGLLKEPHAVASSRHLPRRVHRPGSTAPAMQLDAPATPLSHLPLVGREPDSRTLREIYQAVQQGQMQVVTIQGEAGIGKTHLASTFLQWTAEQGATLLQGRAFEMGGRLPYQPLAHALSRHFEAEPAPEALLSATWLSELSRILPELRERYPLLPAVMGDEMTARIRLFEAVTRLLQALGELTPVVLFLDDVQWADAASLDVLHYAGHSLCERGTPLLLLLALRAEALAVTTPVSRWLASMHAAMPVTELSLGPLTQDETLHLLASLAPGHPLEAGHLDRFADLGQWLFRETRGQPFYLVETLRVLLERQILRLHRTSEGEVEELDLASLEAAQKPVVLAPNVRRLILSQLEQLTPAGRGLVRASTILGQRASFEVLCHVADLQEEEALLALSEVLGHGLLREVSEEDGRGARTSMGSYLFGHDKMREVIYTEMGEAHRHLYHRRALSALEALARPAAELAQHALAAGLVEPAVRYSLAAGEEAVCLLANAEASLHYSRALEALSHLPETADTRALRVDTILKLVLASFMTTSVEQQYGLLVEAEDIARALSDQRRLAHVHYWIGSTYSLSKNMRKTLEYCERALSEAQEVGDENLAAQAAVQLSRILMTQGNYGPIEGVLAAVIPTLEQVANWREWTHALGTLGVALAARGQVAAGVTQVQRTLDRARRAGDMKSREVMASHIYLSLISLHGGDPAQMLSESRQAVEGAQQLGEWLIVYLGYGFSAWAQSRLGQPEEGMQSVENVQSVGNRLGLTFFQDTFAAVTAELRLLAGQTEEALARAGAVVELANEVGGILSAGLAHRVWGQALARLARWEEAEAHLAESWQTLLSGEVLLEAARTQVAWGLLCRDYGELASAQGHLEQAAAQFEASGLTKELETVQSYLAQMM